MNITYIFKRKAVDVLLVSECSHNFPVHLHHRACAVKVLSGSLCIKIDNTVKKYNAGDFFIIPSFKGHAVAVENNRLASYLSICYDSIDSFRHVMNNGFISSNRYFKVIQSIYRFVVHTGHTVVHVNSYVKKIIEYIDDNREGSVDIETLASLCLLSPFYLLHLFKANTGISLHQYIIQQRVKKVFQIAHAECCLTQLALDSGFYDQSHMTRNFKLHVGLTPGRYIKSSGGF